MRVLSRSLAGLVAGLVLGCAGEPSPELPDGPFYGRDVVVIVIDTLRADHLSFGGYRKETAPFLASLSADGYTFTRAYSGASWTAPATASLFTSLYPDHHGVVTGLHLYERQVGDGEDRHEGGEDGVDLRLNRIPTAVRTLPEMMRDIGYRTFGAADNPNLVEEMGFVRGFDHFVGGYYRGAEAVCDDVLAWKDELEADDRPAFLYLHMMDPHKPYHVQEPFHELMGTSAARPEFRADAAAYDSEIEFLDHKLEGLLRELGLDRGALVVLTSDHGEEFGDHGSSGHGVSVHEELLRVPLVFGGWDEAGQPLIQPQELEGQVTTLDLLPTLRELLGVPADQVEEGVSLAPQILGELPPVPYPRRTLFAHRRFLVPGDHRELYSVIDGPWRLQVDVVGNGVQLFNAFDDPQTKTDLAEQHPGIVKRMLAALDAQRLRERAFELEFAPPMRLDGEQEAQLGELGYSD